MFNSEEIANIILHVILISSFLCIFFFTYASKIEEKIVKKQVVILIGQIKTYFQFISPSTRNDFKTSLDNLKLNFDAADSEVSSQNKRLLIKAFTIIAIVLIIGLIVVWYMAKKYNFNFIYLLKENIIILLFVALTEFVFLTFFAQQFISIDPSAIKLKLIDIVENGIKTAIPQESLTEQTDNLLQMVSENINIHVPYAENVSNLRQMVSENINIYVPYAENVSNLRQMVSENINVRVPYAENVSNLRQMVSENINVRVPYAEN